MKEVITEAFYRPGNERWLIIEKFGENQFKYFISNASLKTSLKKMVEWIHQRWQIEQGYQQLKEELGLDHFEGRSWRGLHHHVTLCFMAYAFLYLLKLKNQKKSVQLTLPQVRTWLNKLFEVTLCPYCRKAHLPTERAFFDTS